MPNVRIRIERGDEQAGDSNNQLTAGKSEKQKVSATAVFAHQMVNTTKQIVSYAANNVGNFTGNYIKQEQINDILDIAGDVGTIGLGAVAKGWIGAIVATVGVATKRVFQVVTMARDIELERRDLNYMVARSGNNATTNGSRGTEN